jgi:hypothetical protein
VEVPVSFLSTLKAGFFLSAQTGLETALLAGHPHRHGMPSEAADVDHGQESRVTRERLPLSSWVCTNSPQSVGGPRWELSNGHH